ncbi:response regulator transcription factor [Jonesia quinghaiensis]|uniref:response regulator transcription factor n=1 Tax=Jonesia quinghaiensis TaxID=262806 RepID=UPI000559D20A|nr:response regulator transcription factor [Jonesia quinghaiensis]
MTGTMDSTSQIRVVIVDDDTMVRRLLTTILHAKGMAVVAECTDGDQVIDTVQAHFPDVVIMDIRMARVSGIDAARQLRELPHPPGVIAITSFDTDAAIVDAIDAGVAGFLSKDSSPDDIATAVQQVAAGEGALSHRAARVVLQQLQHGERSSTALFSQNLLAALTEREVAVVSLVAQGLSNSDVAQRLFIGEATVKTHLKSAMEKTGSENRVQLATHAVRGGLVT